MNNMNNHGTKRIDTGYTWFTPVWGYVHQLFFFFIIFFQSSYMHRATKPTPHRTGDLCAPRQIHNTEPSYNHLHLALQVLNTQYARSLLTIHTGLALSKIPYISCTNPTQISLISQIPFIHHLATYLYITKGGLNMGKPMGRHPIPVT
jgi:hypothetical protein